MMGDSTLGTSAGFRSKAITTRNYKSIDAVPPHNKLDRDHRDPDKRCADMSDNPSATILIVDDEEDIVSLLENGISLMGNYRTLAALSGEEALKIIEKEPPDLVLLDIMMDGMSGTEVCRAIKADSRTSHIPVVAVTVVSSIESKAYDEIMKSGVDDYVEKPFDLYDIKKVIERQLKVHGVSGDRRAAPDAGE